ncbi:MAG: hypothetical protein NC121_17700 [Blautia sp.]|nr:hypothetical protein [Blautia sp.]
MYLKVKQGSKKDHMWGINRLILKMFEYAVRFPQFDKEEFEKFLEDDEIWSVKCYSPTGAFYKKIEELFGFSDAERRDIYRTIRHDMEFDRHIEDPGYLLEEDCLTERQRETVKELIMYLYENLFRNDKLIVNNQTTGYQAFMKSLFEKNSYFVCPACLTEQTNLMEYGEVDHYFPKKDYPALVFHPVNLTAICGECNGFRVKGTKNPFRMGNLTELYIPYLRAAEEEVELEIRWVEEKGEAGKSRRVRKMMMVPGIPDASGLIDKRIRNMDELYALSKRWTYRMNATILRTLRGMRSEREESNVKESLRVDADKKKRQAQGDKAMLLEATTLSYINAEGQEAFLAEWRAQQEDKEIMENFWEF